MNYLITIGLFLFSMIGFSQDRGYEVKARYKRPVKKEQLAGVKLISDVVTGYPVNWITHYISVEIFTSIDGKQSRALSKNNVLTDKQKNILGKVNVGDHVGINVKYTYKVPVTNTIEINTMRVYLTVVPEIEAEYIGGYQKMIDYLKENSLGKISKIVPEQFQQVTVSFTINEVGETANAKIFRSSSDVQTDSLLIKLIQNMPKWKPAEDSKGTKIKQEFNFNIYKEVGKEGC